MLRTVQDGPRHHHVRWAPRFPDALYPHPAARYPPVAGAGARLGHERQLLAPVQRLHDAAPASDEDEPAAVRNAHDVAPGDARGESRLRRTAGDRAVT